MKLTLSLATICIAASLVTPAAVAQESSPTRQTNIPAQPGQEQMFFRADKLIGRNAQSPIGQNLGDIKEIVFNPEKGVFGVVQTENDRLAPLPWSLVTAVTDKAVVFNTSPQELAGAPSFTDRQWASLNDPQFTQRIESHFKQAMGGASDPGGTASGASSSSSSTQHESNVSTNLNQGAGSSLESESDSAGSGSSTNSAPSRSQE